MKDGNMMPLRQEVCHYDNPSHTDSIYNMDNMKYICKSNTKSYTYTKVQVMQND